MKTRFRPPYDGGDRRYPRRPYDRGFGGGYPYAYPYIGWAGYPVDLDPWLFGPDNYDSSDNSAQNSDAALYAQYGPQYPQYGSQDDAQQAYSPYPQQPAPPPAASPRPSYTGPSEPSRGSAAAGNEEEVTVIFKDGRPAEKIHNYMLTSSTLTVLDPHYRDIPLDQVDVGATEAVNRAAGVDFRVPAASRQ